MDEGALGRFHLGTGVVESLAAPHDGTQGFLQGAVQLRLIQPGEKNQRHTTISILRVQHSNTGDGHANINCGPFADGDGLGQLTPHV